MAHSAYRRVFLPKQKEENCPVTGCSLECQKPAVVPANPRLSLCPNVLPLPQSCGRCCSFYSWNPGCLFFLFFGQKAFCQNKDHKEKGPRRDSCTRSTEWTEWGQVSRAWVFGPARGVGGLLSVPTAWLLPALQPPSAAEGG